MYLLRLGKPIATQVLRADIQIPIEVYAYKATILQGWKLTSLTL